jgi:hypothetical protein
MKSPYPLFSMLKSIRDRRSAESDHDTDPAYAGDGRPPAPPRRGGAGLGVKILAFIGLVVVLIFAFRHFVAPRLGFGVQDVGKPKIKSDELLKGKLTGEQDFLGAQQPYRDTVYYKAPKSKIKNPIHDITISDKFYGLTLKCPVDVVAHMKTTGAELDAAYHQGPTPADANYTLPEPTPDNVLIELVDPTGNTQCEKEGHPFVTKFQLDVGAINGRAVTDIKQDVLTGPQAQEFRDLQAQDLAKQIKADFDRRQIPSGNIQVTVPPVVPGPPHSDAAIEGQK